MSSLKPLGKNISGVEVTNISTHGIWLLSGDKEGTAAPEQCAVPKEKKVIKKRSGQLPGT